MTIEQRFNKNYVHNENPEIDTNIKETLRKKFVDFTGFELLPVFTVNDDLLTAASIVREATASDATSATIYTTPDDGTKTFFLTGISLSVVQTALATAEHVSIQASVGGSTRVLTRLRYTAGAAIDKHTQLQFTKPIPIDRNTNITVNAHTATASIDVSGSITGFLSTKSPYEP